MEESDLETLHAMLGHYARMLLDLQKSRISMGNRVDAMEREGLHPAHMLAAETAESAMEQAETRLKNDLTKLAKRHPMADWIAAQRGIGLTGFALLLGTTGSLDRFPSVSKLWKYLGLHVTPEGIAPKKKKGEAWTHTNCAGGTHLRTCKPACKTDHHPNCTPDGIGTAYAAQGRVLCYQLGEAIVKVGGDGPYRAAYDRKKAQYEADRTDWPQIRRHRAAMRYAVKTLIKEMWIEWHHRMRKIQSAA